jgi:phage shock protein C
MEKKKLYRSQTDKVFAGVCGGIAEYFDKDAVLIRLLWILMTFLGGSGVVFYIIALFIVPVRPIGESTVSSTSTASSTADFSAAKVFGTLFIVVGIIILMDNLDFISFHRLSGLFWDFGIPAFLILLGFFFLIVKTKKDEKPITLQDSAAQKSTTTIPPTEPTGQKSEKKILRRSLTDKKFLGVCGGLAEYFDVDSSIVRVAYAVFTVFSSGAGIIIYFVFYLVIPESSSDRK